MTEQKREMIVVATSFTIPAKYAEIYRKANEAELKRLEAVLNTRIFGELA